MVKSEQEIIAEIEAEHAKSREKVAKEQESKAERHLRRKNNISEAYKAITGTDMTEAQSIEYFDLLEDPNTQNFNIQDYIKHKNDKKAMKKGYS